MSEATSADRDEFSSEVLRRERSRRAEQLQTFWKSHPVRIGFDPDWFKTQLLAAWRNLLGHPMHSLCWFTVSSVSLFLIFVGVLFIDIWGALETALESPSRLEIFLEDQIEAEQLEALRLRLADRYGQDALEFIDKSAALVRLRSFLGTGTSDTFQRFEGEANPLPASFVIQLQSTESAERAEAFLREDPELAPLISDSVLEEDLLLGLRYTAAQLQGVFILVLGMLLVGIVALIASLIRLSLYTRRGELEVMQLVGMGVLRRYTPFATESLLLGFLSAFAALMLFLSASSYAQSFIREVAMFEGLAQQLQPPELSLLLTVCACFLLYCLVASMLVMRRFEKEL